MLSEGRTAKSVAETLKVSRQTVHHWKKAYAKQGLAAIDLPKPAAVRKPDAAFLAKVSRKSLKLLELGIRANSESLSQELGVSANLVEMAWKRLGFRPDLCTRLTDSANTPRDLKTEQRGASIRMRDIANLTGVSKSTVSRALSSNSKVAVKTAKKIREKAAEMGYMSDPALSSLSLRRWNKVERNATLAFILKNRSSYLYTNEAFKDGVVRKAKAFGYRVEDHFLDDYSTPDSLARVLYQRGVRGGGIGFMRASPSYIEKLKRAMEKRRLPLVSLTGTLRCVLNYRLRVNKLMETAVARITEAGFKRIGLISDKHSVLKNIIYDGYRQKIYQHELICSERLMEPFGEKRLLEWIERNRLQVVLGMETAWPAWKKASRRFKKPTQFICLQKTRSSNEEMAGFDAGLEHFGELGVQQLDAIIRGYYDQDAYRAIDVGIELQWMPGESFDSAEAEGSNKR